MNNIKTKQLDLLLHDFELLARTAITQWQICCHLLEDNVSDTLYAEAEENEIIIDRLEVKLHEEVVFTIFQFNPVAADLRKIIAYREVTTHLERIGDLLLNIIHFLRDMDYSPVEFADLMKDIRKMADRAGNMFSRAVFAFSKEDAAKAYEVIAQDDKIDEQFHRINIYLQERFSGRPLDKTTVRTMLYVNGISQNLERIGDNATNIAESAIYLTEGKDIKHGNSTTT
jgi:phosphate transport system protein